MCNISCKDTSVFSVREIGRKCKVEEPLKTVARRRRRETEDNGSHTEHQSSSNWKEWSGAAAVNEKPASQGVVFDINTDAYEGKGD